MDSHAGDMTKKTFVQCRDSFSASLVFVVDLRAPVHLDDRDVFEEWRGRNARSGSAASALRYCGRLSIGWLGLKSWKQERKQVDAASRIEVGAIGSSSQITW